MQLLVLVLSAHGQREQATMQSRCLLFYAHVIARIAHAMAICCCAVIANHPLCHLQDCSFGPDQVCDSKFMLYDNQEPAEPTSHLKPSLHGLLQGALETSP